jgi:hypothetical protein
MVGRRLTAAVISQLLAALALAGCSAWLGEPRGGRAAGAGDGGQGGDAAARADAQAVAEPVVVTLYLMSKCPHCADLVEALAPLARQLGDRLRLDVQFIGRVVEGEPVSAHGHGEVVGDMIELCVRAHASPSRALDFAECFHRRWEEIPEGWQECAGQAEVDVELVSTCVDSDEGPALLAASFERATAARVDSAPTTVIGDLEIVGSRDADLMAQAICAEYEEPLPGPCERIDPLPYVPVTFVVDARCSDPRCDVAEPARALRSLIWGAHVARLDVQSEPGRALYRAAGLKRLPAVVIGEELADDREAYLELRHLRRSGPFYVKTLGRFDPELAQWAPPAEVVARVLVDSRCPAEDCETADFEDALAEVMPAVKLSRLDYASAEGRALYDRLGPGDDGKAITLPSVVFSKTLTDDEEVHGQLVEALRPVGDDLLLVLGAWDPTAELCDNGVDDDGDRQVDCRDPSCADARVCRPIKARRLELFAMSRCPFATQVFRAMATVIDHFGRARTKIDFSVTYIGDVAADGALDSMHGRAEIDEDLRQVCAQDLSGQGYAFVDYLACRSRDLAADWTACVQPPLDVAAIRACAEGPDGQRLLAASFARSKELGFSGSPSWLLNNRHDMDGRTARAVVEAFCAQNRLPECSRELAPEPAEEPEPDPGGCDAP